jgi:putative peptidoglycan lipid II flippase
MSASSPTAGLARQVALAALLISLGNVASRLLGLIREPIIAAYFSRGAAVDAFTLAWTVPNTVYDLLINGAVSAALVPVFSELADQDDRRFRRVAAAILTLVLAALTLLSVLVIWQAPLLSSLLSRSSDQAQQLQVTLLIRWLMPAVLLMGLSGLLTAVLHAQRRFLQPAFVGAVFNAGMVVGVVAFAPQLGIYGLAAGALIGAVAQVLLQLPGLRGLQLRAPLALRDPAVGRIARLYAPVALGIGFSLLGTIIDRWLASGYPSALATMRYATTLIQFPLGLVASAVALAILPTLSRQSAAADEPAFRQTLSLGLQVVLLLIVPATVGLAVLSTPLTALLFERGAFSAEDTAATALALLLYLPGLPAAALDQLLIFAFYARKQTLTPNLIQGGAIAVYLLTALPLTALSGLGFYALVIANSLQWISHALISAWLLHRLAPLDWAGLRAGLWRALLSGGIMAAAVAFADQAASALPLIPRLALAVGAGAFVYLAAAALLRTPALSLLLTAVRARLQRNRPV